MSFLQNLRNALSARADSWVNTLTGVGSALGKNNLQFVPDENSFLALTTLENLYNGDGLAARIADSVPEHALRGGFTISTGDSEVETAALHAVEGLELVSRAQLAWTWGRLYGGGALFLGADDGGMPEDPLDETRIARFPWVIDVDRRDLYPMTWESDPQSARFGQPKLYRLTRMGGTASQTITVHHSRVVRFEGVTPTRRRRLILQGWGESVLQRVFSELQQARGGFAAAGVLLQEASQGVLKLKGLMDMMASDTDDVVKRRLELMDLSRSVARSLLLDAEDESYERVDVGALTGVVDVMDRMINLLAAVSGIPVTVLMGQAPAGLNATGDSDIRNWYDNVSAQRTKLLAPKLRHVVRLMLLSKDGPTGGVEPAGWQLVFPPMWQPTPVEAAKMRADQATMDVAYIDKGVLTPEEVATSRFRKEGWSDDTSIDLEARQALMEADANGSGDAAGANAPDAGDNATKIAAVVAQVAAREISRDSGVALLAASFGLSAEAADAIMGETGRTFFTAPEPGHAAEMDAVKAENAKLKASNAGHVQYTARVIQRAKEGGLELGAFASGPPTVVAEGDDLKPGDVVEVPVEAGAPPATTDGRTDAADDPAGVPVAIVLPLPAVDAQRVAIEGGEASAELHLTLAYLGRRVLTDDEAARIVEVLRAWAAGRAPLPVTLGAVGRFTGTDPAKGDPIYRTVQSVDLASDRDALVSALDAAGFPLRTEHAYVPHVTLAYVPAGARSPVARAEALNVMLNRACLWAGDRRVEVMMGAKP